MVEVELRFIFKGLVNGRYEFWSIRMADEEGMLPVVEWCADQFGPRLDWGRDPLYRWSSDNFDMVYIREQADAAVFRMRWC